LAPNRFATDFRDHYAAVSAAARRICGPVHAADVTQDVFLVLLRQPDAFDPERGSLRSFLLALARHKAVDVLRSETSRHAREQRVNTLDAPIQPSVDDDLLRRDTAVRVRAALAALPTKERDAITTAFYDHCTYRQAAARLGEAEGTTKSRIKSGLGRLRPALIDLRVDMHPTEIGVDGADGSVCFEPPARWFDAPSPAELDLLNLAIGPVLDIGCGPGRHVLSLSRSGVEAVGIDFSVEMVEAARRRGASVFEGSVFDAGLETGRWGTCLLLDGNIGIGACPETLLRRARALVRTGGRVLVEAAPSGAAPRRRDVRLSVGGRVGPSFSWIDVGIDRVRDLAGVVGLEFRQSWRAEDRWFACLALAT